jgi:hypothetical protein
MNSALHGHLDPSQIIQIDSWMSFQEVIRDPKYRGRAFRGQADSRWPLFSSLSRYFNDFKVARSVWAEQEERILRIFSRKAELFLQHVPDLDQVFEWLALMQHHGAPTRLLDFTWSPFVAAFFALERAQADCAIWAVNVKTVRAANLKMVRQHKSLRIEDDPDPGVAPRTRAKYDQLYLRKNANEDQEGIPFVATGEPFNMNQRLIAQSGTFLVPGLIDRPLESILKTYPDPQNIVAKLVLHTEKMRLEAMESLYSMNITHATLFPGIDGMARSLAYELEFHWDFDVHTGKKY